MAGRGHSCINVQRRLLKFFGQFRLAAVLTIVRGIVDMSRIRTIKFGLWANHNRAPSPTDSAPSTVAGLFDLPRLEVFNLHYASGVSLGELGVADLSATIPQTCRFEVKDAGRAGTVPKVRIFDKTELFISWHSGLDDDL